VLKNNKKVLRNVTGVDTFQRASNQFSMVDIFHVNAFIMQIRPHT